MVDVGAGTATYNITVEGITTGAISFTHSDSAATTVTAINAALDAAFGTAAIVSSGASLAAIILTFSVRDTKIAQSEPSRPWFSLAEPRS